MSKARNRQQPRAISESTLAACLARATGTTPRDTLDEVRQEAASVTGLSGMFGVKWIPYPWLVPVADYVMADRPSGLAADVLGAPDNVFLAKDPRVRLGKDLFLVWCGSPGIKIKDLPFRGLVNHMNVGGEFERITAIQLHTCLR